EFAQELACVATERWRRRSRFRIAARQTKPRSHDADRTIDAWHAGEGLEQSSLEHLRMLEHGGEGGDPPRPGAALFVGGRPPPARTRPNRRAGPPLPIGERAAAV